LFLFSLKEREINSTTSIVPRRRTRAHLSSAIEQIPITYLPSTAFSGACSTIYGATLHRKNAVTYFLLQVTVRS